MRAEKISLKHISESLSVSKTLVSMVLNNKGDENGISKETQKRVWAKAKELNYKPNLMARALRMGRSFTIGLVVSDISNSFYSKIARFMEDEATKRGFTLLICSTDENPEKEKNLIRMLINRQVDGIIISTSQSTPEQFIILQEQKIPYVFIDRYFDGVDASSVCIDNYNGAFQAVEHLINQGYNKIAAFAVTPVYVSSIRQRIDGFISAMKTYTQEDANELLIEVDYQDITNNTRKKIFEMLNCPEPIDAIFAVNNKVAIACLESLIELGVSIPKDIAIICFDDLEVFRIISPQISSISQPIEEISRTSIDLLINEIDSQFGSIHSNITLSPKLMVRGSTAKKM
ncbi:MAG: LacI family DNA-binding transcriptional regulator [Bacteroidota bacterium]